MDSLLQLIDGRIQKILNKSTHINSEIAQVLQTGGVKATVKLITTGTEYELPNYSGSDIRVGDMVYVYWKGSYLSPKSAYIGASSRSDFPLTYINGTDEVGVITSAKTEFEFDSVINCNVSLVVNAVISAASVGNFTFTIYIDNSATAYVPTGTTITNGYVSCNFTLPFLFEQGSHVIEVRGGGTGTVTQMKSYIFGQGIKEGGTNG